VGAVFSANEGNGRRDIHTCGSLIAAIDNQGQDAAGKLSALNLATIR
jgi:hypothetical protein